ncbi:MAG: hypothetical protein KJ569_07385 [Candidatus Omnitrophica bacterium]|nr:hypothetical protein [Candidatus Omnitrophota bacterium]
MANTELGGFASGEKSFMPTHTFILSAGQYRASYPFFTIMQIPHIASFKKYLDVTRGIHPNTKRPYILLISHFKV